MLLQALPTRSDTEALVGSLEASHCKEIMAVRKKVNALSNRMGTGESSVAALEGRMTAMESLQTATALTHQLHSEEMEDHSRRNNLRLRGLPAATKSEDLAASTLAIFWDLTGGCLPAQPVL